MPHVHCPPRRGRVIASLRTAQAQPGGVRGGCRRSLPWLSSICSWPRRTRRPCSGRRRRLVRHLVRGVLRLASCVVTVCAVAWPCAAHHISFPATFRNMREGSAAQHMPLPVTSCASHVQDSRCPHASLIATPCRTLAGGRPVDVDESYAEAGDAGGRAPRRYAAKRGLLRRGGREWLHLRDAAIGNMLRSGVLSE